MGSFNLLTSLVGWTIVPDFATKQLLNFVYHKARIIAAPQPGSLQHRKHYATAFAVVIFSYLTYTLVQSARSMAPNFYQVLGVPPTVDENGLKLAFRAFAKRHHPDRPGVGKDGEALFMYVRDAFEALKDPTVRFAYDRFGPDAVSWRQYCSTPREFLRRGLMMSSGYHIVSGIALLFWSAIGRPSAVSFWRYVLFAALLAAELSFILSPFPAISSSINPPSRPFFSFLFPASSSADALSLPTFLPTTSLFHLIFPNRIPYQHILFLHQLFMFLTIALTRVVPQFLFLLHADGNPDTKQLDPAERAIWERVFANLAIADREGKSCNFPSLKCLIDRVFSLPASLILHTILHSVAPSHSTPDRPYHEPTLARMQPLPRNQTNAVLEELTPEMQKLVTETNIKIQKAGPVASAWDTALRRAFSARSSTSKVASASDISAQATDQPKPQAARTKNFWEKEAIDLDDNIITLVNSESSTLLGSPSSSRPGSPGKLNGARTPSTPRMGRSDSLEEEGNKTSRSSSPSKTHSPVRRGLSGAGAGEF